MCGVALSQNPKGFERLRELPRTTSRGQMGATEHKGAFMDSRDVHSFRVEQGIREYASYKIPA